MTIHEFIKELGEKEIKITFSAGKLKYSGPEKNITPELIEKLKINKSKLVLYFWPKEFANIIPLNVDGNKIPLFIIHGDKGLYLICDHLGSEQPIYGFLHPGSNGEIIPYESVEKMAEAYLNTVISIYPSGPFYLIGYSFGGILAYEMAVQFQKLRGEIPILILIDSLCPLVFVPDVKPNSFYSKIRKNLKILIINKLYGTINLLFDEFFFLINRPIPSTIRNFYILNKYSKLVKKYTPEKFKGEMILFRATTTRTSSKYLGWDFLIDNIKLVPLEAHHLSLFENTKSIQVLLTEIEKYLANIIKSKQ